MVIASETYRDGWSQIECFCRDLTYSLFVYGYSFYGRGFCNCDTARIKLGLRRGICSVGCVMNFTIFLAGLNVDLHFRIKIF